MISMRDVAILVAEIDEILKSQFGKSLYYPKLDDQLRLYRLRVWSERHKVSIAYILGKLIPYYEFISKKHSKRAYNSKGIGTTIPVLTGPAAEAFLKEAILKDFPDGENVVAWRQEKQDECLAIVADQQVVEERKPKGILRFSTVVAYKESYEKRIARKRKIEDVLVKKLAKQPWRGNPWR